MAVECDGRKREREREMGHRVSDYFQGRWKIDGQPRLIFRLADIRLSIRIQAPRFSSSPSRVAFRRLNTRENNVYAQGVLPCSSSSSSLEEGIVVELLAILVACIHSRCAFPRMLLPSIFLSLFFRSVFPRHLFFLSSLLLSSSSCSFWSRVWRKRQRGWRRTVLRRVEWRG